jgi:tetratricopeptide (TPR) repeat protein
MAIYVIVAAFAYVSLRLLHTLFPGLLRNVLIFTIALACLYESLLGLCQLLGILSSNNHMYAITGSFDNPGPYGGFLAVCISLLAPFYYELKGREINKITILKLLRSFILIVTIIAFVILPSSQSRGAIIALGCGIILYVLGNNTTRIKIKQILKKNGLLAFVCVVICLAGVYFLKKGSADSRLFIDKIAIKAISENGWKGAGVGHFGGAYGEAQAKYFKKQIDENGKDDLDWTVIKEQELNYADCPDNAFNEFLFVGVEAGPFVMILFASMVIIFIVVSYKRRAIWCYGLMTFSIFSLFSYPLHIIQFQILFPVLLAECISENGPIIKYKTRIITIAVSSVIVITLSKTVINKIYQLRQQKQAEMAYAKLKRWYEMEYYNDVVNESYDLMPFLGLNENFLFTYGQALNKIGDYEKSDSILMIGTKISNDPMFWNMLGNNSLEQGNYLEAEARYKTAFYMVPNRLYPLYLLAKLYYTEGDSLRFIEMTDKLESFVPKVESANTERMILDIKNLKAIGNLESRDD